MTLPLLGAHMSVAGGLYLALERGASIRCSTIQIFTRNSNRWAAKELEDSEENAFRNIRAKTGIAPVFAHCSYLINLAATGELYEKSIQALITEVRRSERLGLEFVVLHPGAHTGNGEKAGLQRVAGALNRVFEETGDARCKIAIENTAGQGSCLGCNPEHLEHIVSHVNSEDRLGFCIDTCHLFAAGHDIRTEAQYTATFQRLSGHIPLQKILAFHLNDSKTPLDSRVDRHQHIGKGYIGKEAFRCLLTDTRFVDVPKVLETPKGKDLAEDKMNLRTLRKLQDSW